MEIFNKEALSVEEQLELLISRGLIVEDKVSACNILKRIGYYHFSAYMRNFQKGDEHIFYPDIEFKKIYNLYNFDKALRHITFNTIEKIEIAYRTAISNVMCKEFDSHWFYYPQAFKNTVEQENVLKIIKHEIRKKKHQESTLKIILPENKKKKQKENEYAETFIAKYYEKYSEPDLPPFWMAIETFTLGSLNRLYCALDDKYKKRIIEYLGFTKDSTFIALQSNWLQPLGVIRNICAHHSRLFNRILRIRPKKHKKIQEFNCNLTHKFYYIAMIMNYYLITLMNDTSFSDELKNLFKNYPNIDKTSMGFPIDWTDFSITYILKNYNKLSIK